MSKAYVVGNVTIKDANRWAQYVADVPATITPWGGELMLRGKRAAVLAGEAQHSNLVVISFPDLESIHGWYASPAYQALIPLRDAAATVDLAAYED
ncbi:MULTISPECIES: DUF1330 domain-containing protein [Halomonas]|uniref:DUF1330 domain-containing protein n=1 Tax=Halomonas chromatireducens TaxID=507626 RepID=A0A0X8HB11_9GAMM|nr:MULTISPECIES: DUF1330 domain-containing protein [Halomonas]AMC99295.1 hypothetical protein LOKO_00198 [Halomonas chromatireducens]MBZ0331192.1 DUF1330 domain-containing protein [Halomonas sp. ANAO-440]